MLIENIVLEYNSTYESYHAIILTDRLMIDIQTPYENETITYKLLHVCKPIKLLNRLKNKNGFDWRTATEMKLIGYVEKSADKMNHCQSCREVIPEKLYTAYLFYANKDKLKL